MKILEQRSLRRPHTIDDDHRRSLPGDELIVKPHHTTTRAITIAAPPHAVWPWIAQLGQGRGGFYSYDFLENLVGCNIHSADQINAAWQDITVGDPVGLAPNMALTAVIVDADHALVVRGQVPVQPTRMPFDFTWAFVLETSAPTSTRLVVRERYAYLRWWTAIVVRPTGLISTAMSRRMLRGIKYRAEAAFLAKTNAR